VHSEWILDLFIYPQVNSGHSQRSGKPILHEQSYRYINSIAVVNKNEGITEIQELKKPQIKINIRPLQTFKGKVNTGNLVFDFGYVEGRNK
jgi:hypothetical protein